MARLSPRTVERASPAGDEQSENLLVALSALLLGRCLAIHAGVSDEELFPAAFEAK